MGGKKTSPSLRDYAALLSQWLEVASMVLFTLDKVPSPAKARPPPTLPLLERNRKVLKVGDLVVEEDVLPPMISSVVIGELDE